MRIGITKILLLLLLSLIPSLSYGFEVKSNGESCDKNIDEAYRNALNEAKKNAVEVFSGVSVSSRTVLTNSEMVRHVVSLVASAQIRGVEVLTPKEEACNITGGGICCNVRIKADLKKIPREKADFGLSLVLNKSEYLSGEEIKINLASRIPCHPYLFSIDEENNIYRILPNEIEKNILMKERIEYPTEKMIKEGYVLQAYSEAKTQEELMFVCTKERNEYLARLFPEATGSSTAEIDKILASPYKFKVEKLSEILTNIEFGSYAIDSVFYQILPGKKSRKN